MVYLCSLCDCIHDCSISDGDISTEAYIPVSSIFSGGGHIKIDQNQYHWVMSSLNLFLQYPENAGHAIVFEPGFLVFFRLREF